MVQVEWRPRLRWGTRLPGLLPAGAPPSGEQQPFRLVAPFLRLALLVSLSAGFGLGAALAMAEALGRPLGAWRTALVQAHGRAQLIGFVGLFILAIGAHFLPRLRGAPLGRPRTARLGLALVGAGVVVAAIAQPVAAVAPPPLLPAALVALALGDGLEWLGATLLLSALVATVRRGPPIAWRGGFASILPFLGPGFATLWLALLADTLLALAALVAGMAALPPAADSAVVDALLFGFALPVALAVSARLLPIYFGVEVVAPAPLLALALAIGAGTALRLAADLTGSPLLPAAGNGLLGAACLAFAAASGVPIGRRRAIRRADPPSLARAFRLPNLLIRSAYAWLVVAGALLLVAAGDGLWGANASVPADAVRHALTAGYLTLLILGAGARLLPGFARQRPRPAPRLIPVAIAANLAALCRVLPPLAAAAGLQTPLLDATFGLSGVLALLAIGLFTWEVWPNLAG